MLTISGIPHTVLHDSPSFPKRQQVSPTSTPPSHMFVSNEHRPLSAVCAAAVTTMHNTIAESVMRAPDLLLHPFGQKCARGLSRGEKLFFINIYVSTIA